MVYSEPDVRYPFVWQSSREHVPALVICLLASSLCRHSASIWPSVFLWSLLLPVSLSLFISGLSSWEFDARDNDSERNVFLQPIREVSSIIKVLFRFGRWFRGRLRVTDYLSFHNAWPTQWGAEVESSTAAHRTRRIHYCRGGWSLSTQFREGTGQNAEPLLWNQAETIP